MRGFVFIIRFVQKVISAAEMRQIDRLTTEQYATPSLLLMEAAAAAAAREIAGRFPEGMVGKVVAVLCGRGNNGGDGAALARALCLTGAHVDVALFGHVEDAKGDARVTFEMVRSLANAGPKFRHTHNPHALTSSLFNNSPGSLSFRECRTAEEWEQFLYGELEEAHDVVVDALFGTGLTRPLEGLPEEVVKYLQRVREIDDVHKNRRQMIVSLDIPSGLNADSAEPTGEAVKADLTVTFTAPKPANVLPPASEYCGELVIADIGSPQRLLDDSPSQLFVTRSSDARAWLERTRYLPDSYKNTHGHALVIAGSRDLTGAAVLCSEAAMRAGAGLVTLASPGTALPAITARLMPEIMTAGLKETGRGAASFEAVEEVLKLTERASVIAIGPGLTSSDESTRRFVRAVVEQRRRPVVIDADGLNSLAPWPADLRGSPEHPLILTPHPGEMLRLMGTEDKDALRDRVNAARDFATAHGLILVLKGTRSLVASPDGRVFINPTGNAGLGTAGAGDTLTGIITGFNAQSVATLKEDADALSAVMAAVYVGGMAGDIAARERGMRALVASDIREHLGAAICALDTEGERP